MAPDLLFNFNRHETTASAAADFFPNRSIFDLNRRGFVPAVPLACFLRGIPSGLFRWLSQEGGQTHISAVPVLCSGKISESHRGRIVFRHAPFSDTPAGFHRSCRHNSIKPYRLFMNRSCSERKFDTRVFRHPSKHSVFKIMDDIFLVLPENGRTLLPSCFFIRCGPNPCQKKQIYRIGRIRKGCSRCYFRAGKIIKCLFFFICFVGAINT